jgi:hypothetical protein
LDTPENRQSLEFQSKSALKKWISQPRRCLAGWQRMGQTFCVFIKLKKCNSVSGFVGSAYLNIIFYQTMVYCKKQNQTDQNYDAFLRQIPLPVLSKIFRVIEDRHILDVVMLPTRKTVSRLGYLLHCSSVLF